MSESREATGHEALMMADAQAEFALLLRAERERQDRKWGKNIVGIDRMLVVLGEEIGEVCRAHLESSRGTGKADLDNLKEELVQSAAVLSKLYELLAAGAR